MRSPRFRPSDWKPCPHREAAAQIRHSWRAGGAGQCQAVAAAVDEIVEQDAAGIVAFRNRKADFAGDRCAGNLTLVAAS